VTDDARGAILARIRDAYPDPPASVDVPRDYARALDPGVEVIELFAERVADYRATVHRVAAGDLPGTVAEALARRGARRLVVPAGLPGEWLAAATDLEPIADDPPLVLADLDAADGVVTGCAVAIAETGTIVLDSSPDQGRRMITLVPDYHLCVVRADQVVQTVPEAVARLDPDRPLTWISGPSATSDIELNRVEGVHGPRTLEVVLVS